MKWYQSLKFKISLIFIIAFLGISVIGVLFIGQEVAKEKIKIERYSRFIVKTAFNRQKMTINHELLKQEGFIHVKDKELIDKLKNLSKIQQKMIPFFKDEHLNHRPLLQRRIEIVHYKGDFYVLFERGLIS